MLRGGVLRARWMQLAAWLMLATSACAPEACSDRAEQDTAAWVKALTAEPGDRADSAETLLVARGHAAILYLETGLYDAEPAGRARIARVLGRIGDRAARPVLEYLRQNDSDPVVRESAASALISLPLHREPASSP